MFPNVITYRKFLLKFQWMFVISLGLFWRKKFKGCMLNWQNAEGVRGGNGVPTPFFV